MGRIRSCAPDQHVRRKARSFKLPWNPPGHKGKGRPEHRGAIPIRHHVEESHQDPAGGRHSSGVRTLRARFPVRGEARRSSAIRDRRGRRRG